jgi:hypothetical protein
MKKISLLTLVIAVAIFSCKKKKDSPAEETPASTAPSVNTNPATFAIDTAAKLGGNVTSGGSSGLTEVGVCWDTLPAPTNAKPHLTSGSSTGPFSIQVSNLKTNKTYYVRAYAINSVGTTYGAELTFKTLGTWSAVIQSSFATLYSDDNNNLYNASYNGIQESTDNSTSWHSFYTGQPKSAFSKKSNLVYAWGPFDGLHRSTDGGANWITSSGYSGYLNCFSINSATVYAGGTAGAYLSTNYGNSWLPTSLGSATVNGFYVKDSTVLVGTSGTGVFRNDFFGLTNFTAANNGLTDFNVTSMVNIGATIFVATNSGAIFKSTNKGSSWSAAGMITGLNKIIVQGSRIYAASTNGIYFTDDDGATWMLYNRGLSTVNEKTAYSIAANSAGVYFFGADGWIHRLYH